MMLRCRADATPPLPLRADADTPIGVAGQPLSPDYAMRCLSDAAAELSIVADAEMRGRAYAELRQSELRDTPA